MRLQSLLIGDGFRRIRTWLLGLVAASYVGLPSGQALADSNVGGLMLNGYAAVQGISVTLKGNGNAVTIQTNQYGQYYFPGVKPGTYTLSARPPATGSY